MKKQSVVFHILCAVITAGFIIIGVFNYSGSLGRIIESCRDLGLSFAYMFGAFFGAEVTPTVNDYPLIPFFDFNTAKPTPVIPETTEGFADSWCRYWQAFASLSNLRGYGLFLANLLLKVMMVITLVLPYILIIYIYLVSYLKKRNNDYNKDSKPLKVFKWIASHIFTPIKKTVIDFVLFVKSHKPYYIAWICLWLFYFNAFTIFIEFIAYYFYFVISFDFANIYRQIYKLFLDLSVPFTSIPWWIWIIVALIVFNYLRRKIALNRLNHLELRNRGFINARPIVYMVCGTMGKKKTTAITDMALSQEVMFRDVAFKKILENDLKFPYFPWCNLENELKKCMQFHTVYNLASVRKFVDIRQKRWNKNNTQKGIFDYDYKRYGLYYNDKLKLVNVWEVISVYAQLYFIYIIQSSLLISNYSVRVDNVISDVGNFPLWNSDFFKRDSRLIDSYSRHAHILDFDSLRLGKKVIENNINANNFEFGVVLITEVGKERGNNLELMEKKKKDETANQKNDNFNGWLKMVRHSATVDNFPFVRVITDEQRPESWGADARDLCEIVNIKETSEIKCALPFCSLGELLYTWLINKFGGLYYKYRYNRADNTLPMYLLKSITALLKHHTERITNTYGFCVLSVQIESGTGDGSIDENKYFLMSKKIYSKRFSTDCFSDFFTQKALRSPVGIDDLYEYRTEKATFKELAFQNSYFVNDLLSGMPKEGDDATHSGK